MSVMKINVAEFVCCDVPSQHTNSSRVRFKDGADDSDDVLRTADDVFPREPENAPTKPLEIVVEFAVAAVTRPVGVIGKAIHLNDQPCRRPSEVDSTDESTTVEDVQLGRRRREPIGDQEHTQQRFQNRSRQRINSRADATDATRSSADHTGGRHDERINRQQGLPQCTVGSDNGVSEGEDAREVKQGSQR